MTPHNNQGGGRTLADFTIGDRMVISERHWGWERATYAQLALIFNTHPNTIRAICHEFIPAASS